MRNIGVIFILDNYEILSKLRLLPAKARFGQTADAKSGNREKAAGKKLWFYLRGEQIVNRRVLDARHGSDVEDIQIMPAKHHARNIFDRHADPAINGTIRRIANQLTSDDLRIPKEFLKGPEPDSLKEKRASLPTFTPGNPKSLRNFETIYLDTETTGVTLKDQIVEIAIVNDAGETLLNSLVHATCPVHKDANKLHGLTLRKVAKPPSLKDLEDAIIDIVRGKHIVTYNLEFDLRFLTPKIKNAVQYASCCMRAYAEYRSELTEYDTYMWFSLNEASVHLNYDWEGNCHRALPDALACRAVWQKIKG